jgi:uncharacterized protein YycO
MRFLYLSFLVFLTISCQNTNDWTPQEGDILFQDGDCGDFCEAIRKVTNGYQGRDFSHNGILVKEEGEWQVVEAISNGVSLTPLQEFLDRHQDVQGNPKVIVGRVTPSYRQLIPNAISHAKSLLGKPYDSAFNLHNDAYYCSELIHLSFQKANLGNPIFEIRPMTFKDPQTREFFGIWVEYFENLQLPIPEGDPGLNPGGMSLDPALDIIYDFSK